MRTVFIKNWVPEMKAEMFRDKYYPIGTFTITNPAGRGIRLLDPVIKRSLVRGVFLEDRGDIDHDVLFTDVDYLSDLRDLQ